MTLAETLNSHLPVGTTLRFGQLRLSRLPDGVFDACHVEERIPCDELEEIESIPGLRDLARYDATGEFRPLKTAPTLKSGWRTRSHSAENFLKRLDAIYPGVFATWVAYQKGEHLPTSLRNTLDRQTGMYRFAGTISDTMAERIQRELCDPACVRKIVWPLSDQGPVSPFQREAMTLPVICTEACTFAVSRARELAREAYDKENAPVSKS